MSIREDLDRQLGTTYALRTPQSRALHERATHVLPGGDTRTGTFFLPWPTFMDHGEGSELVDVDGNRYVDFLGNYTSLIHGHADPRIAAAVAEQARRGTALGYPSELQVRLAELLRERVPALEQLRFCNSGSEAIMQAIRAARAFTGRRMIVKIEGSYGGAYDAMQISVNPAVPTPPWPTGVPDGPGVSPGIQAEVLIVPFNDLAQLQWTLERYGRDVAAVVIEPVVSNAGLLLPRDGYLEGVLSAARAVGALSIVDEIVTFRLAVGGAQELWSIAPDLVTLGKIIGGGLPVGAFGGRSDVMALYDPRRAETIAHSGTFNGNHMTMAAGLAAMESYGESEVRALSVLGDQLRRGLQHEADSREILATVQGIGSLAHVHFCRGPVESYRDGLRSPAWCRRLLHLGLLLRGFLIAPKSLMAVNTAMTASDVDALCSAFGEVLDLGRDVFPRVAVPALRV